MNISSFKSKNKFNFFIILLATFLFTTPQVFPKQKKWPEILKESRNAVVQVFSYVEEFNWGYRDGFTEISV